MALKDFSLAALHELQNGEVDAQFKEIVADVVNELNRRPEEKKPRVIQINFAFVPVMVSGALDDVKLKVSFKSTVPKYESREYVMSPRRDSDNGMKLVFQPISPNDPRQMALGDK